MVKWGGTRRGNGDFLSEQKQSISRSDARVEAGQKQSRSEVIRAANSSAAAEEFLRDPHVCFAGC